MRNNLQGAKVFVAGVNSYVAGGVANKFAENGAAHVVGTYLNGHQDRGLGIDGVRDRLKQHSTPFTPVQMDQTKYGEIEDAVRKAIETMGGLDVVILAAARQHEKDLFDIPPDETKAQVDVNLTGNLWLLRETGNKMMGLAEQLGRTHRAILAILSVQAKLKIAPTGYAGAKAGFAHMVQAAAPKLARYNIRFNGVLPGTVHSPLELERHGCGEPEYLARWEPLSPLNGKPVTPDDVGAAAFMLSNSETTTGALHEVDNGFSLMQVLPQRVEGGEHD